MTREEAIELRLKNTGGFTKAAMPAPMLIEIITCEIDFYIETGMLKLDEPKSAQKRLDDLFTLYRLEDAKLKLFEFLKYIDEAGLKIVEK